MARHIHPGHISFSMGGGRPNVFARLAGFTDASPSQIRRTQKNAGSGWFCTHCGEKQFNHDGLVIHQKVCEYRDPVKKAALDRARARRRQHERRFDLLYDFGYMLKTWVRRLAVALHVVPPAATVPVRGPEPTYPSKTQRLLDSVAVKYGRPCQ